MHNQFGEFQIIKKLGEGGMGVVYKAKRGHQIVALKTISPSISKDTHFQKRFLREMKVVSEMNHPNIVKAMDFGVDLEQSMYFVALEFVNGESLQDRLNRLGRLALSTALEITKQIAEGLQYANEKQIIHRDIKPDNILLGIMGEVKITDFGLVKNIHQGGLTQVGDIVGTPLYIAPEMVESDEIDGRADIYSLGITLYQMLAGRPPFVDANAVKLIHAHCNQPLPPLTEFNPQVPSSVIKLIEKMTAKEPENRFSSPLELIDCLVPIQRQLEKAEPSPPPGESDVVSQTSHFARSTRVIRPEVEKLGEKLVELGVVEKTQLSGLLKIEHVSDRRALVRLMINYGMTSEQAIAQALAKHKKTALVEPDKENISLEIMDLITPEISTKYGCIPVKKEGNILYLATETPLTLQSQKELQAITGFEIRGVISTKSSILKVQAKHKKLLCGQCQKPLEADWKFCPFCSYPADSAPPTVQIKRDPTIILAESNSEIPGHIAMVKNLFPSANILTTDSGKQVLEQAKDSNPDLIMMDIKLSEISGMMVCMNLRNSPATCHIPLLMMTGQEADQSVKEKAYLAGVDEFLTRPLQPQELKVKLERILKASSVPVSTFNMENVLTTSKVMIGQLDIMGIPDLIQTMVRTGKTGTLILTRGEEKSEIYFHQGRVVHAKLGEIEGEEAFYKVLAWVEGKFRFRKGDPEIEETIKMDTMGLLMEGCRLLDEEAMG